MYLRVYTFHRMIKLSDISRIKDVKARADVKSSRATRAPTKAVSSADLARADASSLRHAFQVFIYLFIYFC